MHWPVAGTIQGYQQTHSFRIVHWNSNMWAQSAVAPSQDQRCNIPQKESIHELIVPETFSSSRQRTTTTSARACSGVRMSSSSAAFGKRLAAVTPRVLNKVPRVRYGPKSKARAPKAPRCRTVSTVAKSACIHSIHTSRVVFWGCSHRSPVTVPSCVRMMILFGIIVTASGGSLPALSSYRALSAVRVTRARPSAADGSGGAGTKRVRPSNKTAGREPSLRVTCTHSRCLRVCAAGAVAR